MSRIIALLTCLVVLSGCATGPTNKARFEAGEYALVFGGARYTSNVLGVNNTLRGELVFGDANDTNRFRRLDHMQTDKTYTGQVYLKPGSYELVWVVFQGGLTTTTHHVRDGARFTVGAGEVAYIGEFESMEASQILGGLIKSSDRHYYRRDDFEKFRSELRAKQPELADRLVYKRLEWPLLREGQP